MPLDKIIEAILFYKTEPLSFGYLAKILHQEIEDIKIAVEELGEQLENRGLRLIVVEEKVALVTAPEIDSIIRSLTKKDASKDIGKAGLETLSLVLYRHPIERIEIDYIRGVNSSFILRHLLMKGLIEKRKKVDNKSRYVYVPTPEALAFLGVEKKEDIPNYDQHKKELDDFIDNHPEQAEIPSN